MKAVFIIAIRGIRTHLGRLALTLLAVTLGVGFVSGSLILTDSLSEVFDGIVGRTTASVDARVQAVTDLDFGEEESVLTNDLVAELQGLNEVEEAYATVYGEQNSILGLNSDGEAQQPSGPPVITFSWDGGESEDLFTLVEGNAPSGEDQVAIDSNQAEALEASAGDIITFTTPSGLQELEIAGIFSFDISAGAWFTVFDLAGAQAQFDSAGIVDDIELRSTSTSSTTDMISAASQILPEGIEIIDQQEIVDQDSSDFNTIINIFSSVLLGFASVALFVSLFIIYNTFAILVGQRTQEIGMLRAIGASRAHIAIGILIEAFILGVFGAAAGLVTGIGVSKAIQALITSGGGFPEIGTVISTRTIVVCFFVGVLATMASAIFPAYKAGKVSPIEAMNGVAASKSSTGLRTTIGSVLTLAGLALVAVGLFVGSLSTTRLLTALGLGAVLTFLGVALLSVIVAGPAVRFIGAPIAKLTKTSGRMAVQNAARSPERTASTATALMIGLALVTTVMVLGQSLKSSFTATLDDTITAEIFVYPASDETMVAGVLDAVAEHDSVDLLSPVIVTEIELDGDVEGIGGITTSSGTELVDFHVSQGNITDLADGGIMVFTDKADELGLSVGDTIDARYIDGGTETITVEAIYDNQSMLSTTSWIMDASILVEHEPDLEHAAVAVSITEGADSTSVADELTEIGAAFGDIEAKDQAAFQEEAASNVDSLLVVVNGLLGLALIVAFFGIINTIVLSVLERTREIGLLRAVGMTRRQLRAVIRWEGVIVSVYGALLGIGLGVLFAWAAVSAVPDSILSTVTIPWLMITFMVIGSGLLGVIAAVLPARRAAKMDVLSAISTS